MKSKFLFLFSVLIILMAFACTKNEKENEILQARTQLELARTKSDLDNIFIALNNLILLGDKDPALPVELETVKKSLSLYTLIRVSQSDGTHEKTIQFAQDFLEIFPNDIDVRKALRESGQIFRSLSESLNELQSCFVKSANGEFTFIPAKDSNDPKIDFEIVTTHLIQARSAVDEALKRDQNFDTALNLRRLIINAQIALSSAITKEIFTIINRYRPAVEKTFDVVHSEMQKSLRSRFSSPQKVWKRFQANMTTLEDIHKKEIVDLDRLASILCRLENDGNEERIVLVKNAVILYDQYVNTIINPRGSLADYNNDISSIASKWSEIEVWYNKTENILDNIIENITNISSLAMEFCLYKTDATPRIIQKRLDIIAS
jgi:hypothetical protein